jgi:hypothetical protein
MIVNYNGFDYPLDLEEIEVEEARTVKRYAGLSLKGLEEGLAEGDADAMTCLFWLMLKQSGQDHNIEKVTFKIVKFAKAVQEAQEAQATKELEDAAARAIAKDAATPKE